jgi:hypothetical protein
VATLPPVSSLFAALLGVNPVQHLLAPSGVLAKLPVASQRVLTGREFFPDLISAPFHHGLVVVFAVAAALAVLAAFASLLRGGRYVPPAADGQFADPNRCSHDRQGPQTTGPAVSRPGVSSLGGRGRRRPPPGRG